MQRSPLSEKTPNSAESIAASRSASANTTHGDLPPSSIDRPLRLAAALRKIDLAGGGLAGEGDQRHVRVLDQGVAGLLAEAVDEVEHAVGQRRPPRRSSAHSDAESGVNSAGLSTTVLPVASAGASFQDSSMNGVFHGVIRPGDADRLAVDVVDLARRGPCMASSVWATIRSAKKRKFSAARCAWPRAWVIGRPVSKVSSSASRASWASTASAIRLQDPGALARLHLRPRAVRRRPRGRRRRRGRCRPSGRRRRWRSWCWTPGPGRRRSSPPTESTNSPLM